MSKRYMIKVCYQEDDLSYKTVKIKKLKTPLSYKDNKIEATNMKQLANELQHHTDFFEMLGVERQYMESTPYSDTDRHFWNTLNKVYNKANE